MRRTSEVEAVPERRGAVALVQQGDARLCIAWPGEWRTDLFDADDLEALEEAVAPARSR